MSLTFDEEAHKYFWKGQEVPGVSAIIRETGQSKDWSAVPEYYRDRGTALHLCVKLWIAKELDESSIDPAVVPYFEQFKAWVKDNPFTGGPALSENAFYSEKMAFAGTIDLIASQVIWDLKCSKKLDRSSEWQYRVQGAGYRTLIKENLGHDFPFKILLLTGEGPAQVIPLDSPYRGWEHVVGIYNLKMRRTVNELRPAEVS